jgi:type VI secretion system protein ImpG
VDFQDDLVDYYRRELSYLRESGDDFSKRYPKVANRLSFSGIESKDPHTERLLESFAFLTARIQREIDREFPSTTNAILENLSPNLTQTIPSIGVVQMSLDPTQGKVMSGIRVQKGTALQTPPISGQICRFQTSWDTDLWPLLISSTHVENSRSLCLKFETTAEIELHELELDRLRLHVSGDLSNAMPLYDMLTSNLELIEIVNASNDKAHKLSSNQFVEVGYSDSDQVLPANNNLYPAYSLLQEYFAFPRKFLFFDLKGLKGLLGTGSQFTLKFTFKSTFRALSSVNKNTFQLGCTPCINLFQTTSEPIEYDQHKHEYLLVADYQREAFTEIHSIQSLIASDPDAAQPITVPNIFATNGPEDRNNSLHWSYRKQASLRKGISGTDTFLSFIDRQKVSTDSNNPIMFAKVLCTNRHWAEQIAPGTKLIGELISSSIEVTNLYEPSSQKDPLSYDKSLFSLIEILRLNHQSLLEGDNALDKLTRLLLLFSGEFATNQSQIRGIKSIKVKPSITRIGRDNWRGHCMGYDIWLDIDESNFVGGSILIFCGVLARFFALYTTTNSYTRVGVMRNGEIWRQWPPFAGWQCLI